MLWLHVVSDVLITVSYYSIPLTIVYFLRKRKDLPFTWLLAMVAAFIVACGTTHLLSAITVWIPLYWLDGLLKGFTAILSVTTAVLMIWIVPRVLSLPSAAQLQAEIHQRTSAEHALQKSEAKYHALYDSTSDAVVLLDESGFFECNAAALKLFGCAAMEEICSRHPADLSPPEQPCGTNSMVLANQRIAEASTNGGARFEWVHRRMDTGEQFTAEVLLSVMELDGKPVIQATVRDISERKKAEQVTQAAYHYARSLIEASLDPLVTISAEGKITDVNTATEQVTGVDRDNLIGSDFADYFTDPEKAREGYQLVFSRDFVFDYPLAIRHVSGTVTDVLYNASVYHDANGNVLGVFAAARDITEYKRVEEELIRSNAELEQFAYAVSHDMRQPLRMVTSYLSLLESALAGQLDEESQQFLAFAANGAKRMDAMIMSLLDYSRIGRKLEAKTRLDSKASLEEALAFLEPERSACGGEIKVTGDWPELLASQDELTRLLQNLIGNALKYHEENQPPLVHIHGAIDDFSFRVEVRDQGIGIEADQMNRLFKVFSRLQARSRYEGNGVGLALCRKIVEHHGGAIGVESDGEGRGCVFWFELPLDKPVSLA